MDLDAYVLAHRDEWRELEALLRKPRLTGVESQRLVQLYQAVGTHLSMLRSLAPDPALLLSLSNLLARARRRMGRSPSSTLADLGNYFARTLPAALYRLRRWWVTVALVNVAVGFALGIWLAHNPARIASVATPQQIEQIVNVEFENYYSTYEASHFAAQVWTNNAWLTITCVALGVLGVPVIILLWQNVMNVALMGAIMTLNHRGTVFWTLILPHGLLELTSVFVGAGVGLRLFWSWVEPGPRSRMANLAREGRTVVAVALGLVVTLAISGLIEAFVTPSHLPPFARLTIGVLAWLGFLIYALVWGRRVAAAGVDGDVAVEYRGTDQVAVD